MSLGQGFNLKTVHEHSTLHDELCAIGYNGSIPADYRLNPLSAHFELHIEQGSQLERARRKIGVVKGIQGNRRMRVNVQGKKAHSGTAPMRKRSDALVAASNVVLAVEAAGFKHGGFATVGVLSCEDASINCVPGKAFFTIDLRHPSRESLDAMEQSILTEMKNLEKNEADIHFNVEKIWESPAARFDEDIVDCVKNSALDHFDNLAIEELNSFAGHDSAMTHLRVPTAMIFVPSRNGISHAPEEFTSQKQW
jgi:N-carbamoyl-L-amino-acid hydrolase